MGVKWPKRFAKGRTDLGGYQQGSGGWFRVQWANDARPKGANGAHPKGHAKIVAVDPIEEKFRGWGAPRPRYNPGYVTIEYKGGHYKFANIGSGWLLACAGGVEFPSTEVSSYHGPLRGPPCQVDQHNYEHGRVGFCGGRIIGAYRSGGSHWGRDSKLGPWSGNRIKCGVKSMFVNLDFTQHSIRQKPLGNGGNTSLADEERDRPNYMTGETCRKNRGCAPCDKDLTNLKADGCLVPVTTGKNMSTQEWFGMSTNPGSDLTLASTNVEFRCNHTGQRVPMHFYAESVHNGEVALYVNDRAQSLTSMCVYACMVIDLICTRVHVVDGSVGVSHGLPCMAGSCNDWDVRLTGYPRGVLEVFFGHPKQYDSAGGDLNSPPGWYPICTNDLWYDPCTGLGCESWDVFKSPIGDTVCKKLGYESGNITAIVPGNPTVREMFMKAKYQKRYKKYSNWLSKDYLSRNKDAFQIGGCQPGQAGRPGQWGLKDRCTGNGKGGAPYQFTEVCRAGGVHSAGVEVTCSGKGLPTNVCKTEVQQGLLA